MKRTPRSLIAAVCLLSAADAIATLAGVRMGLFIERNALLAWALDSGAGSFAALKGSLTTVWAAVALRVSGDSFRRFNFGVLVAYASVVAWSVACLAAGV